MAGNFVHLNVHSHFSLLSGASGVEALLARAKALGFDALALTDTNGLYGALPFIQCAKKLGIKPIVGAEIEQGGTSALCLVRDRAGYANLCRLITARQLEEEFCLAESLVQHRQGLFILTPTAELLEKLAGRIESGSLFREVRRLGQPAVKRVPKEKGAAWQKARPVATNSVHFASPEGHEVHRTLTAIRLNKLLSEVTADDTASPEAWLKGGDEMARFFADEPEAVANARRIADACNLELETGRPIFPKFFSRADMREKFPGETPYSALCALSLQGAQTRYRPLTPEVIKRLEYELDVIHRLGFAEYFLIVWDIVRFASGEKIPIVGRGSAANSLVAYCLGITSVDPLHYKLYFERFLNLSRTDCPDIDLDICWRRRDEVLDYVYGAYGDGCVAMVCNHNTFQARSAFRDIARVFGLPIREINRLTSMLPHYAVDSIEDAMKLYPEMRNFPIGAEPYRTILERARAIDGFPRHLSIHSGGLVIGDRPLTHYLPLERATKGIVITQYEMHAVEAVGLVKIDLLGHRSLTVINDTVRAIEAHHGVRIDPAAIRDGDGKTAATLLAGRTIGCFQIESPGMRSLLQMVRAENRLDVIHALSLIRPGPSGSGMKERFIRRRLGEEPVRCCHPCLKDVLADTYGVMLFQEDTLKVAEAVAGFTLEEGDALRKAISKKRSPERIAALEAKFIRGALERGVARTVAREIWDLIGNFAGYAYCKAHAVTYGHISYQATWLKTHYPAEFLASVMTNAAGFYEVREYVEEARRWGVRILPPDVNESAVGHTGRGDSIRIGLGQVKGLSRRALHAILRARKVKKIGSLEDFCARVKLSRPEAESLILCGALDGLGCTRPAMLWKLRLLRHPEPSDGAHCDMLGRGFSTIEEDACSVPALPEYSVEKRIELEQQILDLAVTDHPLRIYEKALAGRRVVPTNRLGDHVGRSVTIAGCLVTMRRAVTKRLEYMKFMTIEDRHGTVEVILFPETYRRFGHLIRTRGPYLVHGKVECNHGAIGLTAAWVGECGRMGYTNDTNRRITRRTATGAIANDR